MPCLTQALTRQPVGEAGSGEAERTFAALEGGAQGKKGLHGGRVAGGGCSGGKMALDGLLQLSNGGAWGHGSSSLSREHR